MPGCQHLTPRTSACRHLRLCLSFSCPQCRLTHVTYPAPITGQPWGEPTCWRWHELQLKHQLPPRPRMAGWFSSQHLQCICTRTGQSYTAFAARSSNPQHSMVQPSHGATSTQSRARALLFLSPDASQAGQG